MGADKNAQVNSSAPVGLYQENTLLLPILGKLQSLEFLGLDKKVLRTGVDGIHFGLFDNAVERDPDPPQWPPSWDPLLNQEKEDKNFVGADSRRFYIQVKNPDDRDIQTLSNGTRIIKVYWSTTYSNDNILDDNKGSSNITLMEETPGAFVSRGLMLVTTNEDNEYPTHCGIPTLYPTPQDRRVGDSDHRTRRGSMFGKVHAKYNFFDVYTPVYPTSEQKSLPLQIFAIAGANGRPAMYLDFFTSSLSRSRAIYERLGIFLYTIEHPDAERFAASGQRTDVRKVKGGLGGKDFFYLVNSRSNINSFTENDKKQVCSDYTRTNNIIRVFIIGKLASGSMGEAYGDDNTAPMHGSVFIQSDSDPLRMFLAHEVGHLLTDKSSCYGTISDMNLDPSNPYSKNNGGGHFTRPRGNNRFIHFYNVLGGGTRSRLWDVDVEETSVCDTIQKRTFNQFKDIRKSVYLNR